MNANEHQGQTRSGVKPVGYFEGWQGYFDVGYPMVRFSGSHKKYVLRTNELGKPRFPVRLIINVQEIVGGHALGWHESL